MNPETVSIELPRELAEELLEELVLENSTPPVGPRCWWNQKQKRLVFRRFMVALGYNLERFGEEE